MMAATELAGRPGDPQNGSERVKAWRRGAPSRWSGCREVAAAAEILVDREKKEKRDGQNRE